jgi:hypothetical protein
MFMTLFASSYLPFMIREFGLSGITPDMQFKMTVAEVKIAKLNIIRHIIAYDNPDFVKIIPNR